MRLSIIALFVTMSFLLIGCSENGNTNEAKQDNKKNDSNVEAVKDEQETLVNEENFKDLPDIPQNEVDIIHQRPGVFANKEVLGDEVQKQVIKHIEDLPPLPEKPSKEEYDKYFQYVYSLAANDFPDPDDLVKKWEFSMYGSPEMENPKFKFKENYNVEIILDSSGSMNAKVGDQTQMELAKEAINDFVSNLPKDVNISLRVYGHKGTGDESDKEKSCSSIEQVYGFDQYNQDSFSDAINQFKPSGWTPIAESLKQSFASFKEYDKESNTNLIYLVSDGIETCDGDPVAVAKEFAGSNVSPIINVIGFNVDSKAQEQLKQVAESSDGIYSTVTNKDQLTEEFERAQEILERWESWKTDAIRDADAQRVDNSFDILGFSNDWNFIETDQSLRVSYLLTILREQGKINFEQRDALKKRASTVRDLIDSSLDEILEDLKSMNENEIESLKEEIKNKYKTEVE
ncbi:VWA domain-containing protein [Bacillus sp. es.034]|uniref:VWA domain-containing protein n=1 Tax=Bacillus sp. es.034 TaxID=1761763 RepID=UPI000BF4010F|nr:VWA domain-containing protein [Bacillus sp. es.034]PFG03898.1 Ca-activated chloride channel family protein [Bacillus sp. es.034]